MKALNDYVKNLSGHELSDRQMKQYERYYEMLVEKNKVMNLTAITERDEVCLKHFIDSIAICEKMPDLLSKPLSVIDVGCGAGFPGLPLKILASNIDLTLYDALRKRIDFLQEVIDEILPTDEKIRAVHGRAEEGGRNQSMRDSYDLAVSRAVSRMSVLAEYCLPFVKVGGYFVAYKSDEIDEEIKEASNAIDKLGGTVERIERLTLPGGEIKRSFVFVKKIKPTPKAYPRKPGTAAKDPL